MNRFLLSLVFVTSFSVFVSAQNTITIHQKDGQKVSFGFAEKPVITYTDNDLVVTTTQTELQYPLTSVSKLTFSDEETAVVTISDEKQIPVLTLDNYVVDISGAKADASVKVYASDGKMMINVKTDAEGFVSFSIAELPEGIYIIKSEGITCKILKK